MKYELKLTSIADQQVLNIYIFGAEHFGVVQAEKYYDGLMGHIDDICDNPFAYVRSDDIKPEHRRSVYKSHSIYYRVSGDLVEVMAVIGRQDFAKVL